MNPHTLKVLEYSKILEQLAGFCAFSGGAEMARSLLPSDDLPTIKTQLAQTAEAFRLLEQKNDIGFGGVKDLRLFLDKAERGSMLFAPDLLEIKNTLLRARSLRNLLTRLEHLYPLLAEMAYNIEPCDHVSAEI